jgi:cation:H+ antiporter
MAPFVVGILVVGVGTSVPELVASVYAAFAGVTEIVVGNVLGSNITNILLVLGIAGLLGKETRLKRDMLHIDLPMVLGSAILLGFLIVDGSFTRMDAVLCLTGTVIYVYSAIATDVDPDGVPHKGERLSARVWIRLLGSLGLILLSAKFTVDAVVVLAAALGVGTEIIALSAVALGTSLPEIVIATMAARQGKIELAVGNIMGSNVFNAFAVMGLPGIITPLAIPGDVITFSLPFFLGVTLRCVLVTVDAGINRLGPHC